MDSASDEADWRAWEEMAAAEQSARANIDANDVEAIHGIDAVRVAFAQRETPAGDGAPELLPLADLTKWDAPAPVRRFAWGTWVPFLKTTMLTGAGGVGKSLLEQMMLTCIALGRDFLGMETMQGRTLYLTAEDDLAELWHRQKAICAPLGVEPSELAGKLHIVSLVGENGSAALMEPDEAGRLAPTKRWRDLRYTVRELGIRFVALDTATDMFGGDHNDLHQVAEFVNLLTALAIEMDGAVILLHHPNKAGEDWLGSVAWHNKVRSRLIVKKRDGDPDGRTIENPKSNYGRSGGSIDFRWYDGAFVRDDDLPADTRAELDELMVANGVNAAFMQCLAARNAQGEGRQVGPAPGPNYAPSQFEGMPEAKGCKRDVLKLAMQRLYANGTIRSHTYRNTAKGRDVTVIVEAR